MLRVKAMLVMCLFVAACAGGGRQVAAPSTATTVDPTAFSAASGTDPDRAYRIGRGDKLQLTVFQVPDLSLDETFVDATGRLQVPLLGSVEAEGRTPQELATLIEEGLGARYLRDPSVVVTVTEAASSKITVDGAVTKPGVYEMQGRTSLLQAVAMAEGPTRVANLGSVAVFRNDNVGRMVAVFDLQAIRNGQSPDPVLLGDDVVIVDTSRLSSVMRDVITTLPSFAAFAYF